MKPTVSGFAGHLGCICPLSVIGPSCKLPTLPVLCL